LGTYTLGNSTEEIAAYVVKEANSTVTLPQVWEGNGQIVLTEYDTINRTVSGVFKFNAENSSNNPLEGTNLNFQQGVFYKVPISALINKLKYRVVIFLFVCWTNKIIIEICLYIVCYKIIYLYLCNIINRYI
jgi:hypothetical protein